MFSGVPSVLLGNFVHPVSIKRLRGLLSYCSLFCVLGLTACGHTPVTLTLFEAAGIGKSVDTIKLNPNLSYLRVTVGADRVALMVLGYLEPTAQGPIETWYSSEGEVLKLQNGRVVSTAGMAIDWRAVRYTSLLPWPEMVRRVSSEFGRQTDQMPGYKYGIDQKVSIAYVPPPSNTNLQGLAPNNLRWYEETVQGTSHGLPSARYGLRLTPTGPVVVYGQQCFADNFCISWQPWPATP